MRLERGERATWEILWHSYHFGFPRMLNAPGQVLVVLLPTREAFATRYIRFGTRPPKTKLGKRKCSGKRPTIWMKCGTFVDYLEKIAGLSFLAAFGQWYNAISNEKVSQRFEYDVKAYSVECYTPMTLRELRALRLRRW